jgi:hypothetical protein
MEGIMLVDVATAALAMAILALTRVPRPKAAAELEPIRGVGGVWRDVAMGFAHLKGRSGLLELACVSSAGHLFVVWSLALLPLLVAGPLAGDAKHLAWSNSAFGIGTIAGGFLLSAWGGFENRSSTAIAALFGLTIAMLAVGAAPDAFACGVAVLFVGFFLPLATGPITAVLQAGVAADFQARIFSLTSFMGGIAALGGLFVAAPLASCWACAPATPWGPSPARWWRCSHCATTPSSRWGARRAPATAFEWPHPVRGGGHRHCSSAAFRCTV